MERGPVPVSPPSTCRTLAQNPAQSIACNELVGSPIAPFQHTLELFVGPGIEINGLDPTNVCAHAPVDARTPNADEDTQVPGRPSRIYTHKKSVYWKPWQVGGSPHERVRRGGH